MEIPVGMAIGAVDSRKVTILGALFFATLMMGCFGPGWGGGGPGYYGGTNYYTNDIYRGYGRYPEPGLFGGYAPGHDAWAASTRGRTSYGRGEASGGHVSSGGGGHASGGGNGRGGGHGH